VLVVNSAGEIAVTKALGERLKFLHEPQTRVVP
jgi:hypothetical protein